MPCKHHTRRALAWAATLALALASPTALAAQRSIAFYYGSHPPGAELAHFDQVVVEPGHVEPKTLEELRRSSEIYAYLSIGEVNRASPWHARLQRSWLLTENAAWDSDVIDPLEAGGRALLLAQAEELWARGYRGFFLDTLDSPLAVPSHPALRQARIQALGELLRELHRRLPGVKLLLNRGFELLPEAAPLVQGVVAESLFSRWVAAAQRYEPVPEEERRWLREKLTAVRERHGLPVVVIDYVAPAEREQARAVARDIQELGFTPYVTNGSLDMLGVSTVEVIPRRVLVLYDGAEGEPAASSAHQLLAVPLEALGFTLDYVDVRGELPTLTLTGRYAGVVGWLSDSPLRQPEVLRDWLDRQWDAGVRVTLFGDLGFARSTAFLARRGLAPVSLASGARLGRVDELVGFEAPPAPHARALPELQATDEEVRVHLSVSDLAGHEAAAIVTGPWGGFAMGPYVLEQGFEGRRRWILDPFTFLERSLAVQPFPAPDFTTENGRRLLVIRADGEGIDARAAQPGLPLVSQVARETLLERYALPTSLSLSKANLRTPALRAQARRLAQRAHLESSGEATHGDVPLDGFGRLNFENLSLTTLCPALAPASRGSSVQVYSPLVDARSYPMLAHPPHAYARLIQVFEWTETPRRLGPLALYYPLSACATPAGIRALEQLHSWLREQSTLPLWLCEYTARVQGFAQASMSRRLDGSWLIRGLGALRTLRLPPALGWPELEHSRGVAGFSEVPQGRYVSLSASSVELALSTRPPARPLLAWANAPILSWRSGPELVLRLRGHRPVSLALAGVPVGCRISTPTGLVNGVPDGSVTVFHFPTTDTGDARLTCP